MGIAPSIGGGGSDKSLEEFLQAGLGFTSWSFHPNVTSGSTAPTAGTIYVTAVPHRTGEVITKTAWIVGAAGSGTAPTHIFTGICDASGKMLAQSSDDAANANWTQTTNIAKSALASPCAIPSDGIYYHVLLQVGSWGTTQMALGKGVGNNTPAGLGTVFVFGTAGTTQTALPANGSSLVVVGTSGISYWSGSA